MKMNGLLLKIALKRCLEMINPYIVFFRDVIVVLLLLLGYLAHSQKTLAGIDIFIRYAVDEFSFWDSFDRIRYANYQ